MTELTQARLGAIAVAAFPVVGLLAATYHPFIGDLADNEATARVIAADPTRWGWSHVAEMGANVLAVLGILALGAYLRASGERTWSFIAVPLIATAMILFTAVLGMSVIWAAMSEAGSPIVPVMDATETWYAPVTLVILVAIGLGLPALAVSVYRSHVLSPPLSRIVAAAIWPRRSHF